MIYDVYYEITGKVRIEAASPQEAERQAQQISQRELGEQGLLEIFDPEPIKEEVALWTTRRDAT